MALRARSNRKNIMREFTISELSAVDRPAQAHARVALMKRADDDESFGEGLAELQERLLELAEKAGVKKQKATKAEANYREAGGSERCGACEHFDGAGGCSVVAGQISASDTCDYFEQGDSPMTEAEKKQLAELEKTIQDLTKKLEAATASEPAKKAAELQDAVETLTKKLEAAEAEKATALAKAGMSDSEKGYAAGLEGEAKTKFMNCTPAERKKLMSKAADDDPVVYKADDGQEFRKSDDPRLVAMAKRADEQAKKADSERESRETLEHTKRAEDFLKNFSGEAAEKVDVVRAISKMAEKPRAALEKMLEAGGKAIAAAFETIGHNKETLAKTAADFNKRVDEIQARDKCSRVDAMSKARLEDPAAFDAYQSASSSQN